jgi:hypothetical protein
LVLGWCWVGPARRELTGLSFMGYPCIGAAMVAEAVGGAIGKRADSGLTARGRTTKDARGKQNRI